MEDQTNRPNDSFGKKEDSDDSGQNRPLTSFLQARQSVLTEEKQQRGEEQVGAMPNEDILMDGLLGGPVGIPTDDEPRTQPVTEADNSTRDFDSNKLNVALKALRQVEQQIATVISLLGSGATTAAHEHTKTVGATAPTTTESRSPAAQEDLAILKPIDGRVVEGVFDGRGMVGADGKSYLVPPNYASKSKLVEGDMLKLTITPKGSFIYKQIGPIERSRLIGSLGYDQTIGEYYATSDNRRWNVLKASVTYFKGEPGDEVVLLVPKNAPSRWAAVENIIKRNPLA